MIGKTNAVHGNAYLAVVRVLNEDDYDWIGTELVFNGSSEMDYGMFRSWDSLFRVRLHGVIRIRDCAFQYCSFLSELYLPNSLQRIDDYAFQGCTSLCQVHLPASLTFISSLSFYGCSGLTNVTVGAGFDANLRLSYTAVTDRAVVRAIIDAYKDNSASSVHRQLTLSQAAYEALTTEDVTAAAAKSITLAFV